VFNIFLHFHYIPCSFFFPQPWKPCKARDTGEVFYFNPATGESLWHHPQDDHWASLFTQCKDADGDLFERNEILTHELKVTREGCRMWRGEIHILGRQYILGALSTVYFGRAKADV